MARLGCSVISCRSAGDRPAWECHSKRARRILPGMVCAAFRTVGARVAAASVVVALTAPLAGASEFELSMHDGRVTIRAQDALVTDILAEWGRIGNTAIIDADELASETVTLLLVDVPETRALRILLRTASGYLAAPRATMTDGVSRFDRILILATSKPAARRATAAAPGGASTPNASGPVGQRLGVVPNAPRGRTSFTVSPAQQEQLDQLQQLLQQPDDANEPQQPVASQPAFPGGPTARPRRSRRASDPLQPVVDLPTGQFGSTTPVPDTPGNNDTPVTTIPRP